MARAGRLTAEALIFATALACVHASGQAASSKPPSAQPSIVLLFRNIWRVTKAERQPFNGSIYIFLSNGTLLETSCGEPYRVALWSPEPEDRSVLRITEDGKMVSTFRITALTSTTLQLEKKMVRSAEREEETLIAVKREFVCPDLPK